MKYFKVMGYFVGPTFGELTICADNCAVQKKENITILYIVCPVDTVVCSHVTLLFSQVHTNNYEDHPLNLLKSGHHNRYIFPYK